MPRHMTAGRGEKIGGTTIVGHYKRKYWFTLWFLLGLYLMSIGANLYLQNTRSTECSCDTDTSTTPRSGLTFSASAFALVGLGMTIYAIIYLCRTTSAPSISDDD